MQDLCSNMTSSWLLFCKPSPRLLQLWECHHHPPSCSKQECRDRHELFHTTLPDVQSIVIHLSSFSVWFLLTISTASTLSPSSPHPYADYCTRLLNSLSAFNLSHNLLFGFLDPKHPELLLGRWWVHLMEWWTYSAKRWGERKGRVCIWGDQGAGKQEIWREERLYYRRNP